MPAFREQPENLGRVLRVVRVGWLGSHTRLVGIYSDPSHVIDYHDGEVRQEFSLCFRAEPEPGLLIASDESPQVRWVNVHGLDELDIHPRSGCASTTASTAPSPTTPEPAWRSGWRRR